jgi:hypothetical protein
MADPISRDRLAEIERHDASYATVRSVLGPNSAETHRHELLAEVDRLTQELDPGEPVTDTIQLVIPRGSMLDGLKRVLSAHGCVMAGPLPLEREPIPTYVLQPRILDDPAEGTIR